MYLVRLREPPQPKTDWGVKGVAGLVIKMMDVMNNGGNGYELLVKIAIGCLQQILLNELAITTMAITITITR